jgi:hypothetical protein
MNVERAWMTPVIFILILQFALLRVNSVFWEGSDNVVDGARS